MKPVDQSMDERGQALPSFVAVGAAIAVVIGLLVLFGTRGSGDDAAGPPGTPPPSGATSAPSSAPSSGATSEPPVSPETPGTARTPSSPVTLIPTADPSAVATDKGGERPPVEVYNNTTQRGLGDRVAARARAEGWQVTGVDNWHGKVVTSTVYYPDRLGTDAQALAADLGIGRIKPALDNMKKDRLSVILTTDYAG